MKIVIDFYGLEGYDSSMGRAIATVGPRISCLACDIEIMRPEKF